VVSLFGLVFGMWFARVAYASPIRIWSAYFSLTIIHLAANYIAMRKLALRSLNRNRMGECLKVCNVDGSCGAHLALFSPRLRDLLNSTSVPMQMSSYQHLWPILMIRVASHPCTSGIMSAFSRACGSSCHGSSVPLT